MVNYRIFTTILEIFSAFSYVILKFQNDIINWWKILQLVVDYCKLSLAQLEILITYSLSFCYRKVFSFTKLWLLPQIGNVINCLLTIAPCSKIKKKNSRRWQFIINSKPSQNNKTKLRIFKKIRINSSMIANLTEKTKFYKYTSIRKSKTLR